MGDEVYSENPATGEKGLKKVTRLFVREVTELIHITVGGEEIRTTATHPFWVVGKGWTEAGDLKIGDKLEMYSGEILEVTDGYDAENKVIHELKPNNPNAMKKGMKQLNRYI